MSKQRVDVAIITALPMELDAVLHLRSDWKPMASSGAHPRNFHVSASGGATLVAACATGMGQLEAALLTRDLLHHFSPRFILLVGIAAGLGDASLGDVLVSNQIVDYEIQKVSDSGADVRWSVFRSSHLLLTAAQAASSSNWREHVEVARPDGADSLASVVRIGVILSGNKVIASEKAAGALRSVWTRAVGLEMEAVGVAAAVDQVSQDRPGFIMVKGVCDHADAQKGDDWQEYAAAAAAAFALQVSDRVSADSASEAPSSLDSEDRPGLNRRGLRFALSESFSIEELGTLAFDLGVDWEDISGGSKTSRVIALINYFERRGRLNDLIAAVNRERNGLLAAYESDPNQLRTTRTNSASFATVAATNAQTPSIYSLTNSNSARHPQVTSARTQTLVAELITLSECGTATVTVLVRKAARVAVALGNEFYSQLFSDHLRDCGAAPSTQSPRTKPVVNLVAAAYIHDRSVDGDQVMVMSLAELEQTHQDLRQRLSEVAALLCPSRKLTS